MIKTCFWALLKIKYFINMGSSYSDNWEVKYGF